MESKENDQPKKKVWVCLNDGCDMEYLSKSGRSKHHTKCEKPRVQREKGYTKVNEGVKCNTCNKVLSDRSNYHRHVKTVHSNTKKKCVKEKKVHKCRVCKKEFPKLSKLNRHEAIHERNHVCSNCGRRFKRIDHYNGHTCRGDVKVHEDEEQPGPSFILTREEIHMKDVEMDDTDEETDFEMSEIHYTSLENPREDPVGVYEEKINTDLADVTEMSLEEYTHEQLPAGTDTVDVDELLAAEASDAVDVDKLIAAEASDAVDVDGQSAGTSAAIDIDERATTKSTSLATSKRKVAHLSSVMKKIITTNMDPGDASKILRKSLEGSMKEAVLDNLMISKEMENVYEAKLTSGVLSYLRSLKLKSSSQRETFCSFMLHICDEESLADEHFLNWLCRRIEKKPSRVKKVFESNNKETRGRTFKSPEVRQAIFDSWHEFSEVTADHREGRDQINFSEMDFVSKYKDLQTPEDVEVEYFIDKRNRRMVRSTKRISTKTIRELRQKICEKGYQVSIGTIINLRPFYIRNATEREKLCCLCKGCLNLRIRFNELMKHLKDPSKKLLSMSKYFSHGCDCELSVNGFHQLKCITGECEMCTPGPMFSDDDFEIPKKDIKFYQFVVEKYEYMGKKGEKKEGKRTIRKDFYESFVTFKQTFDSHGPQYLIHRFEIKNDAFHWPQILSDSNRGYIFHQDYSENISVSPKYEPQDAHFSAKQTSLHCSVVYSSDEKPDYGYHISDNKKHDSAFTILVTRDLIEHYEDSLQYPLVRIKSDNCTTQYCCLYVFAAYQKLAKEVKKTIILHYGVNGHGKGLVDAMSGFGVKCPLRRHIITDDFFFNTDVELVDFLHKIHRGDDKKYFKLLPSDLIENQRSKIGKGLPISGCQKARMISFFTDGKWEIRRHLCSCDFCKEGLFSKCTGELAPSTSTSKMDKVEDGLAELDETENMEPAMFEFISKDSIVAMYSHPNAFEMFYLLKVIAKHNASEHMVDLYGHQIQMGSQYIEGHYIEKNDEKKGKVYFKQNKKSVFVYPAEIFCPAVVMDENGLQMTSTEYSFLASTLDRHLWTCSKKVTKWPPF